MKLKILTAMAVALAVTSASAIRVTKQRVEPPIDGPIALAPATPRGADPTAPSGRRVATPASSAPPAPVPLRLAATSLTSTVEVRTFAMSAVEAPPADAIAALPAPSPAPESVATASVGSKVAAASSTDRARAHPRGRPARPTASGARMPVPEWANGVGTNPAQPATSQRRPGPKRDVPAGEDRPHGRGRSG